MSRRRKPDRIVQAAVDELNSILHTPCPEMEWEFRLEALRQYFENRPIPKEIVEEYARESQRLGQEAWARDVEMLARYQKEEMLPWIDECLESGKIEVMVPAMFGLLNFDEARAMNQIRSILESIERDAIDSTNYPPGWIYEQLREYGSPEAIEIVRHYRPWLLEDEVDEG